MDNEKWRPVVGYEGLYSVSNMGRVRSERLYKNPSGNIYRFLKPLNANGYMQCGLYKYNRRKKVYIHRIVLSAFSPVDNCDEWTVDHINGDKADNRLSNLRWVRRERNTQLAHENGMMNYDRGRSSGLLHNKRIPSKQPLYIRIAAAIAMIIAFVADRLMIR